MSDSSKATGLSNCIYCCSVYALCTVPFFVSSAIAANLVIVYPYKVPSSGLGAQHGEGLPSPMLDT